MSEVAFALTTSYAVSWDIPYLVIVDEGLPENSSRWLLTNSKGQCMLVLGRTVSVKERSEGSFARDETVLRATISDDEIGFDPSGKQWIVRRTRRVDIVRSFRVDAHDAGSSIITVSPSLRDLLEGAV